MFAAFYFTWKRQVEVDDFRSSTFSSKRSGYMMFRNFAKLVGADMRTLERPMSDTLSQLNHASQLWLIAPEHTYSETGFQWGSPMIEPRDEDVLADWVLGGGTLIVAPNYLYPQVLEPLFDSVGYDIISSPPRRKYEKGSKLTLTATGSGGLLKGIRKVESYLNESRGGGSIFRFSGPQSDAEVLLEDEYGPAVILQYLGRGKIILVADQYIFSNFLLASTGRRSSSYDNAQFAANILADAGQGLILFDEYYHEHPSRLTFIDVLNTKAGHGLAFLLLVAGLALYSAGRRFGAVLPPPPPGRRSPAEYVVSMGLLFRRAAATGLALDVMERDFAHFLQQRYRLRNLDVNEVEKQLKVVGNPDHVEIIAMLNEIERLKKYSRPSAKRLVRLSRRIDNLKGV